MVDFRSPIPCPPIPDNLTAAQFLLDSHHSTRPIRTGNIPWLIEDKTGRKVGFEEVHIYTWIGYSFSEARLLRYDFEHMHWRMRFICGGRWVCLNTSPSCCLVLMLS